MRLLTPREETIAREVAAGKTGRQIATKLHLSVHTVEGYIKRIALKIPGRGKPMMRIAAWWKDRKRQVRRLNEGPGTPEARARARREREKGK